MASKEIQDAIEKIQQKVLGSKDKTKESRARKGAYVDCLIILKKIAEGK